MHVLYLKILFKIIVINLGRGQILQNGKVISLNSNQLTSVINSDRLNKAQETGCLPLSNQSIKKPQFCLNKCKNNFERCSALPGYSLD